MESGTIVAVSLERSSIIVQIDHGGCAVFVLLDGIELTVGDRVGGDLEGRGGKELQHLGQRCTFNVHGLSGPCSLDACERLLGI